MHTVLPSDYQPLVCITVPMTDDAEDGAQRIALIRTQTWHKLEVIPVYAYPPSGFAQALNLTLPLFNFHPSTLLISEKCTEASSLVGDKSLGLWCTADLQLRKQV